MDTWLPVILSVAGAVFLAAGTIVQWLGHEFNARVSQKSGWQVLSQWRWWTGIGLSALGTLCYYVALWRGALALVQPLSALHIVFTALWMGYTKREVIRGARAIGIALVALGTLACLAGEVDARSSHQIIGQGIITLTVIVSLVMGGALLSRKAETRFAILSGVFFALSAVGFKAFSELSGQPGMWVAAGIFAIGYAAGFLTMQAGFRCGGAGVVNALATGTNTALPMAAAAWIFGEAVTPLAWAGVAAIVTGVVFVGVLPAWSKEKASSQV